MNFSKRKGFFFFSWAITKTNNSIAVRFFASILLLTDPFFCFVSKFHLSSMARRRQKKSCKCKMMNKLMKTLRKSGRGRRGKKGKFMGLFGGDAGTAPPPPPSPVPAPAAPAAAPVPAPAPAPAAAPAKASSSTPAAAAPAPSFLSYLNPMNLFKSTKTASTPAPTGGRRKRSHKRKRHHH